jgi:quercetin dioxygenase-like cupin family protein
MSLSALGKQADVSAAAIHKIEQSGMVPTITTLLKLASALERPIAYFVNEDTRGEPTLYTSAEEIRPIYSPHRGITLNGISGTYDQFTLAGAIATVTPAATSGNKPLHHPGEELVYIFDGELEFVINAKTYLLSPGDTLHFRGQQLHSWRNPGTIPARALWMALRPQ